MPSLSENSKPFLLLVGPGKHFGIHLVERFLAEGFRVGIIASTTNTLLPITEKYPTVVYATADVRNPADIASAIELICTKSNTRISCLIFNVKLSIQGSGLEITPGQLMDALSVNVGGALATIQAALPWLDTSKPPSIILTGGGYKDYPDPNKIALSVSKAALHTMCLSLIPPLQARGILMKTIVIDGVVRGDGPLRSQQVANFFWDVFLKNRPGEFLIHS